MDETDLPLSDYILIGNGCAAALVSRHGSIDWCCLPEFDAPGIFSALLDDQKGGRFRIHPRQPYRSSQRYVPDTNVAETRFITGEGEAIILDAFIALKEEYRGQTLHPDHEILRVVEGISGAVNMKMEYAPRFFFGKTLPVLQDCGKLGIRFYRKEDIFLLQTTLGSGVTLTADSSSACAEFQVKKGERIFFSMSYSFQSPAVLPELRKTAWSRMQNTILYWKEWIGKCRYTGVYQEAVKRSALVLKLLAHAPSGAIVAAPTTSLPEQAGGERNWDYRYCWLRDASFTVRVLIRLGFTEEAHAYMNWILHATNLTHPALQVVYTVYGRTRLWEQELNWLKGYRGARPVRIGNGADKQFQLDLYGEVIDAFYTYTFILKKELDRSCRRFITGLGKKICEVWNRPDNGIWEIRSQCVHHTHSKAMAWAGLDRLIKIYKRYQWEDPWLRTFRKVRAQIRETIERYGYNESRGTYTRVLQGSDVDASLLTLSLVGYCDVLSPRMISTVDNIVKDLSNGSLVYRYRNVDDGLTGGEGAFVVCSFWLIENLAQRGDVEEAMRLFDNILDHASPAGLLSEEIDPVRHEMLGNYPQGFSHIGLVNAALSIDQALRNKNQKAA